MTRQQLRASQLITTFGPGAMLDLPDDSVIVGGLEGWHYARGLPYPTIEEPRLQRKVQELLKVPDLTLRAPPAQSDDPSRPFKPDVEAWVFPQWFTVKRVEVVNGRRRRRLVPLLDVKARKFEDADGKKHPVVPVRFVRACNRGHVDDIAWHAFVHGSRTECMRPMHFVESGTSADLADIVVLCECGASEKMSSAANRDLGKLGWCSGQRPWLGPGAPEGCVLQSKLLVRTASNAYFARKLSAISIPPRGQRLDEFVAAHIDKLKKALEAPVVLEVLRGMPPFTDAFREHDDAEVLASVRRVLEQPGQTIGIKDAEFEALSDSKDELGSDQPGKGDFFARALPRDWSKQPWTKPLRRVVLVHRLREVVALVGFTRFESSSPDLRGELDLGVDPAPLARDLSEVKFVPALENRGEGIFLEFEPAAIRAWVERSSVKARSAVLEAGFESWKEDHQAKEAKFLGAPYVLLHTISHLLMTSLSLECGYPSSSLRERIYALTDPLLDTGRYGILIYTGSSDAEGTLGGLVQAGHSIERHLRLALDGARLCSNDPVCAYHDPAEQGHSPLLGAACHGCVLVAETSCERMNEYLDRSLVVPTVKAEACEFFEGLP